MLALKRKRIVVVVRSVGRWNPCAAVVGWCFRTEMDADHLRHLSASAVPGLVGTLASAAHNGGPPCVAELVVGWTCFRMALLLVWHMVC